MTRLPSRWAANDLLRGRAVGTFIVGAIVLAAVIYAVSRPVRFLATGTQGPIELREINSAADKSCGLHYPWRAPRPIACTKHSKPVHSRCRYFPSLGSNSLLVRDVLGPQENSSGVLMRLALPAAADLSPSHPLEGRAAASFFCAGSRVCFLNS